MKSQSCIPYLNMGYLTTIFPIIDNMHGSTHLSHILWNVAQKMLWPSNITLLFKVHVHSGSQESSSVAQGHITTYRY